MIIIIIIITIIIIIIIIKIIMLLANRRRKTKKGAFQFKAGRPVPRAPSQLRQPCIIFFLLVK